MADKKKIRYGGMSAIEKMEEAAGISESKIEMPYKKGEAIKSGEVAREWTGPRPWLKKQSGNALRNAVFGSSEAITRVALGKKKKRESAA